MDNNYRNGKTLSQILNPDDTGLSGYQFSQTGSMEMESVPEPATILGSFAALGLGISLLRKRTA